MNRFTTRPHENNNPVCISSTVIFKTLILSPSQFGKFIHCFLHNIRSCRVKRVDTFPSLEINIRVLSSTPQNWSVRSQTTSAVSKNKFIIDHFPQNRFWQKFNFLYFVGSAETIKEMNKWQSCFQSGNLRNKRQVVSFLYRSRTQHRKTSSTSRHHITVVAKYRKTLSCQRTSCNMNNTTSEFPSNFIKIRNH